MRIRAKQLNVGDWIVNHLHNERVVEIEYTRDGQIKVYTDYGNGGEPATNFFEPNDYLVIER